MKLTNGVIWMKNEKKEHNYSRKKGIWYGKSTVFAEAHTSIDFMMYKWNEIPMPKMSKSIRKHQSPTTGICNVSVLLCKSHRTMCVCVCVCGMAENRGQKSLLLGAILCAFLSNTYYYHALVTHKSNDRLMQLAFDFHSNWFVCTNQCGKMCGNANI